MIRIACFCLLASLVCSADWPQFRGPGGQGIATATDIPTTWGEDRNVAWKTAIPGRGLSSPVIDGNQIWLTSAIDKPTSEEDRPERLKTNTGNQPLTVSDHVRIFALCVDRKTGKILHEIDLLSLDEPQWVHKLNSYATPTPILRDGRLYCHFGTFGNACVDTKAAKLLWTNTELNARHENGPGSSPELWKNRFMVVLDGSDQQYVAALDTETGKLAWKTARSGEMHPQPQLQKAYASPLLIARDGKPELVSPGANWVYAYNPETGEELWKVEYGMLGFSNVARPVYAHGMVYISTGFMKSQLQAITFKDGKPNIAWRATKGTPKSPSPLISGDRLYMMGDKGILTCLDAKTGESRWQARLNGKYSVSPTLIDGNVHVSNVEGVTTVFADADEYTAVAINRLDGELSASPAAVDKALFMRTDKALYCIGHP